MPILVPSLNSSRRWLPSSRIPCLVVALAVVLLIAVAAPPAAASEVEIFRTANQRAILAGTLEGIAVDDLGRLRLADRVERLTAVDEPFLLAAAAHPDGWVVGTGNAGRVLLVKRSGEVEELFAADEPEIFAVAADDDGTVWAASSPGGKVYRIARGADLGADSGADSGAESTGSDWQAEAWFDPGETYVWALARGADGALLVATGTQGRLYRVAGKDEGRVVYDSEDTHIRSLLPTADGGVLVGTAGEGWIQRLTPNGADEWRVRTLYDAAEPEVVALAAGPDGSHYAALVASEASLVDLSRPGRSTATSDDEDEDEGEEGGGATVIVTPDGAASAAGAAADGSRRSGFRGPRSEVVRIAASGQVESLWQAEDETVFDLLHQRGRLWVATGTEGKLYAWNGSQMVLEKDVEERQVVALMEDSPGPAFATTNAAALFRVSGGTERQGTFTSATLDASQISRFGTFRWRGEVPRGAGVEVAFRSGISSEPDRTWSEWSDWSRVPPDDSRGGEVAVAGVPQGRYVQWRARLRAANGRSPLIYGTELTYRQENLRPRVEALEVLPPGEILVPSNFNPGSQTFEPTSPRPDGVFTTLRSATADGNGRLKTLWKPGYRSLRWQAEDDNDDDLVYRLSVRPAEEGADDAVGGEAGGGEGWLAMAEELTEDHYVFDSRVLPDGVYRFRLEADDRLDNPAGTGLGDERASEPVVVDHSPPALVSVERLDGQGDGPRRLRVRVEDAWSPVIEARVSADAGDWRSLRPQDGLLDGRAEVFEVEVPAGARLLLLHLSDAAFNEVTFDLLSAP